MCSCTRSQAARHIQISTVATRFLTRPMLGGIHRWSPTASQLHVLSDFPHSQHRPSILHIGLTLPIIHNTGKTRWNFRKADWEGYTAATEKSIPLIPRCGIPIEEAYNRFSRAVSSAARAIIPRVIRARYIPCMDEEAKNLLEEYEDSGDPDIADHLIESLDAARRARWEESTAQMNFTHSSRKSWAL